MLLSQRLFQAAADKLLSRRRPSPLQRRRGAKGGGVLLSRLSRRRRRPSPLRRARPLLAVAIPTPAEALLSRRWRRPVESAEQAAAAALPRRSPSTPARPPRRHAPRCPAPVTASRPAPVRLPPAATLW
uniref:Uncharacterized protein n=1 Tax=Setaria viridis TaxID=4556 RepID=A0A4U6UZT5_SETVI|nr:hypothetical protein SEVIR_4G218601v2 [Setaria viridis]